MNARMKSSANSVSFCIRALQFRALNYHDVARLHHSTTDQAGSPRKQVHVSKNSAGP
jgi:hypothetical protein